MYLEISKKNQCGWSPCNRIFPNLMKYVLNPSGTSFGPSGPQSMNQGGVYLLWLLKQLVKMESEIHNTSFLISPTTHLFPLVGQSGSRGVSSMITFELKIWNN